MVQQTDPAREFSDFVSSLTLGADEKFGIGLARMWDVEHCSASYYQIMFFVCQRVDQIRDLIDHTELDSDLAQEAKSSLGSIKTAFSSLGLENAWSYVHQQFLTRENIRTVSMLSGMLRSKISFPKLDPDEIDELSQMTKTLISELEDIQLYDSDFIRYAIINGLKSLLFRLERLQWIGWEFTAAGLREVIEAYYALQRGVPGNTQNPQAEAILRHVGAYLKKFYRKTETAKNVVETGDFLLKAYGAVSLVLGSGPIAGLLPSN